MNKVTTVIFLLLLTLSSACSGGSDGDNLQGKFSVNDVNILANNIQIGESVRSEVFFETKTEIDGTPDGLDVVVRIPAELSYVIGSSRIYDGDTDTTDTYTPQFIETCETGETFLVYTFSDFDLFDRELGTIGQFGIRFEVRGRSATPSTSIGATAGEFEDFRCGSFFAAEENEAVQVLG